MIGGKNENHPSFYENEDVKKEDVKVEEVVEEEFNPYSEEVLYGLTQDEQVIILNDCGLNKKQIKDLKYEEDRVKKIIEILG